MSKILVVTLGGTICSSVEAGNTIKLRGAPDKSFWNKMQSRSDLAFLTPILYSSENADEDYFRKALAAIIKACDSDMPDGILILHGTDSLAYFAQLAVRVLSYLNIPVVITGSKLPVSDSHSDAVRNIKYALGLLSAACEGKLGSITFGVVYSDEMMEDTVFTPASRITDADFGGNYGKFAGKPDITILKQKEASDYLEKPLKKLLTIPDVPGYPYDLIDPSMFDAILVEAYHSGTSCVRGLTDLIARSRQSGTKVYLAPVHRGKNQYESTLALIKEGAEPVYDMPFEGAWAEVLIG